MNRLCILNAILALLVLLPLGVVMFIMVFQSYWVTAKIAVRYLCYGGWLVVFCLQVHALVKGVYPSTPARIAGIALFVFGLLLFGAMFFTAIVGTDF